MKKIMDRISKMIVYTVIMVLWNNITAPLMEEEPVIWIFVWVFGFLGVGYQFLWKED